MINSRESTAGLATGRGGGGLLGESPAGSLGAEYMGLVGLGKNRPALGLFITHKAGPRFGLVIFG